MFGGWCVSGVHTQVGDAGNMLATLVIFAPAVVGPLLWCPTDKPIAQQYWFKLIMCAPLSLILRARASPRK